MQAAPTPAATERLQRVRRAVRELMAEQGFRISMDDVALRAGCSKQTLYAQFGSKQALMRSVVEEHRERATASLADGGGDSGSGPGQALRGALVGFAVEHLERLADPALLATCQLMNAEARQFPDEARTLFLDGYGGLEQRLADWLRRAMRRGQLRHDDPHWAAELLLGMIVGADFDRRRFAVPHRDTAAARRQWAEFAVDAFLRAFAPVATVLSIPRR
jgi:AcrR family transcriptional regulator